MPEGKNKIGRPRRNGIYGGAIISRIRSQIRISPNSPSPTTDVNRNPGVTSGRKAKAGSNPGAGPASVADMVARQRSGHTVRETRKKVKNVKGQVSEKRAKAGSYIGRHPGEPARKGTYAGPRKRAGRQTSIGDERRSLNQIQQRRRLRVSKRGLPNSNPPKKEKR